MKQERRNLERDNVWCPTRHVYQQIAKLKTLMVISNVEPLESPVRTVAAP